MSLVVTRVTDQKIMNGVKIEISLILNIFFATSVFVFLFITVKNYKSGIKGFLYGFNGTIQYFFNLKSFTNVLLIIIFITFFLESFTTIKIAIPVINDFKWDESMMLADYYIHFGNHPWEIINTTIKSPFATYTIDFIYSYMWNAIFFVTIIIVSAHQDNILRIKYFLTMFVSWIILGNILATIFSSAGPCYFNEFVHNQNPFSSLRDYLNTVNSEYPLASLQTQDLLLKSYKMGQPIYFAGISAFPSIHVSTMTLCALAFWSLNKLAGYIVWLITIITLVGSVHLGWHYAIDGYFSIMITFIIWRFSNYFLGRLPDFLCLNNSSGFIFSRRDAQ